MSVRVRLPRNGDPQVACIVQGPATGRGGRIVNWASDAGIGASPGFSVYAESAYMTGSTVLVDGGATSALGRHLHERMMAE